MAGGSFGCEGDLGALQRISDSLRRGSVGRRKSNADNSVEGKDIGINCYESTEKLDSISLFAENLAQTGPVPSLWQLDDTSGIF